MDVKEKKMFIEFYYTNLCTFFVAHFASWRGCAEFETIENECLRAKLFIDVNFYEIESLKASKF